MLGLWDAESENLLCVNNSETVWPTVKCLSFLETRHWVGDNDIVCVNNLLIVLILTNKKETMRDNDIICINNLSIVLILIKKKEK